MDSFHKPLAYIIAAIIVYFTLQYTTRGRFTNRDLILFTVIATLIFAIVENVYMMVVPKESNAVKCEAFCSMKENLENVSSTTYPVSSTKTATLMVDCENKTDYENFRCAQDKLEKTNTQHNLNYVTGNNLISRKDDGSYTIALHKNPQATYVGSRATDDVIKNEMQYSYYDHNILPPNLSADAYEPGFSYLPPSEWYPRSPHPPICVSEKRCSVCPNLTTGSNPDYKEWDSCRRVMPPDEINTVYIQEKLNSGR